MVTLGGGITGPNKQFMLVTKGSFGDKLVVSGITPPRIKYNVPTLARLSMQKEKTLRDHAKGHTRRHMDYMRQMMAMGLSYKQAHQRAAQFIGR